MNYVPITPTPIGLLESIRLDLKTLAVRVPCQEQRRLAASVDRRLKLLALMLRSE